jgi:hypothetical protein
LVIRFFLEAFAGTYHQKEAKPKKMIFHIFVIIVSEFFLC